MAQSKFLTTGAFARLCNTTKETLFHYDRLHLLKPKHVSGNGYRRYGLEQYFDFDLISTLKETGSSLQEIRECMHSKQSQDFLALLEANRLIAKKEKERLARREQMLQEMVDCTREALNFDYGTILRQRQKQERLEVYNTEPLPLEAMPELIEQFAEYVGYYQKQDRMPRYPFGFVVGLDDALNGRPSIRGFFGRATAATPRAQLCIKPEGEYAVLAHKGTVQTHIQALDGLLRQAVTGQALTGTVYAYDMISYMFQEQTDHYAFKYCVPLADKHNNQKNRINSLQHTHHNTPAPAP